MARDPKFTAARKRAQALAGPHGRLRLGRRGHREVLEPEGRHALIAMPKDVVGWKSARTTAIVAGIVFFVAILLFMADQAGAVSRPRVHAMSGLAMCALACLVLSIAMTIGAIIKAVSDCPIVFDHSAGVFYGGRYQADPARIPATARPLSAIKCVQVREGFAFGHVGIVLTEPEGRMTPVLEPLAQHAAELAQQLAEFLSVPVAHDEEGAEQR